MTIIKKDINTVVSTYKIIIEWVDVPLYMWFQLK